MAQCAAASAVPSAPRRGSVPCCAGILKYPRYIEPLFSGVRATVCNTWTVPAPKGAAEIYNRAEGLKSGTSGLPFTLSTAGRGRSRARLRLRLLGSPQPRHLRAQRLLPRRRRRRCCRRRRRSLRRRKKKLPSKYFVSASSTANTVCCPSVFPPSLRPKISTRAPAADVASDCSMYT